MRGIFISGVLMIGLSACAGTTILDLSYTSPNALSPDLVVLIERRDGDAFSQNVELTVEGDDDLPSFYENSSDLKGCAVESGYLDASAFSGETLPENACDSLRTFFSQEIFNNRALEADDLPDPPGDNFKISDQTTHVFAIFFYNAATPPEDVNPASNRCFEIFAAEVSNNRMQYLNENGNPIRLGTAGITLAGPGASCYEY